MEDFLLNPESGANCQLLALGVLRRAEFYIDDTLPMDEGGRFGSKELWEDRVWTTELFTQHEVFYVLQRRPVLSPAFIIAAARPFQIFFFWPKEANPNLSRCLPDLKRLHVGICVSRGIAENPLSPQKALPEPTAPLILHNAKPGPSCLWTLEDFEEHGYSFYGAKKPQKTATERV